MRDTPSRVRLGQFRPSLTRGRARWVEAAWRITSAFFFTSALPWPNSIRIGLLRAFGANVGAGVILRSQVRIHMPWRISIGEDSWIGRGADLLSLERIAIGSNVCISQNAFLCTGNHDYKSETFDYVGAPIAISDGAWIGAQSFVGPGVTVGVDTVVTAGSVALSDLPDRQVCSGNPCVPVRDRVFRDAQDGVVEG